MGVITVCQCDNCGVETRTDEAAAGWVICAQGRCQVDIRPYGRVDIIGIWCSVECFLEAVNTIMMQSKGRRRRGSP